VKVAIARGDIVRVRLDPGEGREIRKTRPAVIFSNNAACRYDSVVQVVPITALPDRALRPYEARVATKPSGLTKPSRAVANQIRTVAKHRIVKRLGRLSPPELEEVDRAVSIQLGLQLEAKHSP
jgi:mRNA interferase MazF